VGQTNDKRTSSRKRDAGNTRTERFNDARFVQYELDETQRAACKGWDLDGDDLWLEVLALLDTGYSVSVRYDETSTAYACFVTVRGNDQHSNAGLILTGRGSTPGKAVKQAIFKHKAIDATWLQFAERKIEVIDD